ncbi:hypothetical protein DICVIV_03292 [Dictyocaulus viviparus]|uniref:Cysteine rich repeat-containing domain protein n=1 Tax=Dictyocaulus viviparus TaxID=29172 RepID=A0A0D8Y0Y1_DICVI|nr:hypothetical protein DICVIV_03292 [Dictyocaulus viviparus]
MDSVLVVVLIVCAATVVLAKTPCGSLTVCAVQKCLDKDMVRQAVHNSSRSEVFGAIVEKFDMVCIAAKCSDECKACNECHYAIEQMSAFAQGEPTSGLCPKLENCVQGCLQSGDISKDITQSIPLLVTSSRFSIISCVAARCNVHCYDGDCSSCKVISKRMFTIICQQTDMRKLPHIQYEGTCPGLFNELADDYVARKRRVALVV